MKNILEIHAANETYDVSLRIIKKVIEQEESDRDEEEHTSTEMKKKRHSTAQKNERIKI